MCLVVYSTMPNVEWWLLGPEGTGRLRDAYGILTRSQSLWLKWCPTFYSIQMAKWILSALYPQGYFGWTLTYYSSLWDYYYYFFEWIFSTMLLEMALKYQNLQNSALFWIYQMCIIICQRGNSTVLYYMKHRQRDALKVLIFILILGQWWFDG